MSWLVAFGAGYLILNAFAIIVYYAIRVFDFIEDNENKGILILIIMLIIMTIIMHKLLF